MSTHGNTLDRITPWITRETGFIGQTLKALCEVLLGEGMGGSLDFVDAKGELGESWNPRKLPWWGSCWRWAFGGPSPKSHKEVWTSSCCCSSCGFTLKSLCNSEGAMTWVRFVPQGFMCWRCCPQDDDVASWWGLSGDGFLWEGEETLGRPDEVKAPGGFSVDWP